MPAHDTYMLHIFRSRAVNGWQWSARVECLHGGERRSFADPEALLAYLGTMARAEWPPGVPASGGEEGTKRGE